MIRLRLWRRRDDEPAPIDLRFYPDPGIILELLRPREPTPGPVTLQFGRYEPPEYPTIPGTLTASLPPPDVPAIDLTATGESTAPAVTGRVLAEIPDPVLPALSLLAIDETLRGNLRADMPAVAVELGLNAEGHQNLDLPDADGASVGMRWREFSSGTVSLALGVEFRPPALAGASGLADWVASIDGQAEVTVARALLRDELEALTRKQLMRSLASQAPKSGARPLLREEVDERAAVQTARQLALFVNRGYLQRTNGGFRTRLDLHAGELRLNGKAVTLAQIVPQ